MANTSLHRTPTRSIAVAGKHHCRPRFPGLKGDQSLCIQPSALAGHLKLQQAHPSALKLFQRTVFLPGPRRHQRKQLHCLCLHKREGSSAYRHQVCPRGTRIYSTPILPLPPLPGQVLPNLRQVSQHSLIMSLCHLSSLFGAFPFIPDSLSASYHQHPNCRSRS